jgi:hypothetical protein
VLLQSGSPVTFEQLEVELLKGQKLQGVLTSNEVQVRKLTPVAEHRNPQKLEGLLEHTQQPYSVPSAHKQPGAGAPGQDILQTACQL